MSDAGRERANGRIMDRANEDAEHILTEIMLRRNFGYEVRDDLAAYLVEIVRKTDGDYRLAKPSIKRKEVRRVSHIKSAR